MFTAALFTITPNKCPLRQMAKQIMVYQYNGILFSNFLKRKKNYWYYMDESQNKITLIKKSQAPKDSVWLISFI